MDHEALHGRQIPRPDPNQSVETLNRPGLNSSPEIALEKRLEMRVKGLGR